MNDDHDTELIASTIARRREKLGLSKAELARTARVKRDAIAEYERGQRQPRLDTLMRLATALGTDLAGLVMGTAGEGEAGR